MLDIQLTIFIPQINDVCASLLHIVQLLLLQSKQALDLIV